MQCTRDGPQTTEDTYLGSSKDGKISFYVLTEDRYKGAVSALKEYYTAEPFSILYEIPHDLEAMHEMDQFALDIAKDGVSVVGIDKETKEVVGAIFNKIQVKSKPGELAYIDKYKQEKLKNNKTVRYVNFMIEIDEQVDVMEELKVDSIGELDLLVVRSSYRNQGIGEQLISYSIEVLKSKGIKAACLIGSSKYTIMISSRLNFQNFASGPLRKEEDMDSENYEEVIKTHDKFTDILMNHKTNPQ